MALFRIDTSVPEDSFTTPVEYYSSVRRGLRQKANHNKVESQLAFAMIIIATLLIPLFITLGEGAFWGKFVPASLSVLAAGFTSWLQLRKPQRLWAIYRRAQRELEREKAAYDFKLDAYAEIEDSDKLLAQRVSEIAFQVHEKWEGLVPEPDALSNTNTPTWSLSENAKT